MKTTIERDDPGLSPQVDGGGRPQAPDDQEQQADVHRADRHPADLQERIHDDRVALVPDAERHERRGAVADREHDEPDAGGRRRTRGRTLPMEPSHADAIRSARIPPRSWTRATSAAHDDVRCLVSSASRSASPTASAPLSSGPARRPSTLTRPPSGGSCGNRAGVGRRPSSRSPARTVCQFRHLGYVIGGTLHVRMDDGTEIDIHPTTPTRSRPGTMPGSWATSHGRRSSSRVAGNSGRRRRTSGNGPWRRSFHRHRGFHGHARAPRGRSLAAVAPGSQRTHAGGPRSAPWPRDRDDGRRVPCAL